MEISDHTKVLARLWSTRKKPPHGRNTLVVPCRWHQVSKLPYVAWHLWAERKVARGHKQHRCPHCLRWLFRCEWGPRPAFKWPRS